MTILTAAGVLITVLGIASSVRARRATRSGKEVAVWKGAYPSAMLLTVGGLLVIALGVSHS